MPRPRLSTAANAFASPVKTMSIPLNDDAREKAARLQNRHAHHSRKMDELKAAAAAGSTTPMRKGGRRSLGGENLATPDQNGGEEDLYASTRGDHVTPLKRVPILANFEEWMKMATDNKINANNSWNFALIDYFHDMSLLKEGDGVNFQKASCTLDGCVKIYTSRVDSVATETGKLLSGLAENGSKKRRGAEGEDEEGEDGEDDEVGEDGVKKKGRKKAQRSAESTLVNSFDQLRLKKMELEFSVDPLFKKASADFDEGGAKGLLLNHLAIDQTGRIVFDSSDDIDEEDEDRRRDSMEPGAAAVASSKEGDEKIDDQPVDIDGLAARFFPDLDILDERDICPSLKTFELGSGDGTLELPFLKAPENWRDEHPENKADDDNVDNAGAFGIEDDDDDVAGLGGFDTVADMDIGFGQGGEAWAKDAALVPQMRVYDNANALASGNNAGEDAGGEVGFDAQANMYSVTLQHHRSAETDTENILNYFDSALSKNWAGPEHWKIARVKEISRASAAPARAKKEKEPFEVDFTAPMTGELASLLYTRAKDNAAISMPRKDRRSATRHLLPDDKHFNSKDLLKLFLKPKAKLATRKQQTTQSHSLQAQQQHQQGGELDEAYWATHTADANVGNEDGGPQGDYDANFFQDDGLPMMGAGAFDDDDEELAFADARESFLPANADEIVVGGGGGGEVEGEKKVEDGDGFAANLVAQSRRTRPEYVQYARVAKKVDVRRLKEEMWRGCGFEKFLAPQPEKPAPPQQQNRPAIPALANTDEDELRFTDIMNNLHHVYPQQQLSDISTSYGFICLLHLANEKGLVIENVDGWTDLKVRKDFKAVVVEGDL